MQEKSTIDLQPDIRAYFLQPVDVRCWNCKQMLRVESAVPTRSHIVNPRTRRWVRLFRFPWPQNQCKCGSRAMILVADKNHSPYVIRKSEAKRMFDILINLKAPTMEDEGEV